METLSDAERLYIQQGAEMGVRGDGREMFDIRPMTLETLILPTASGSAHVRIGGVTDILVGIKAEVIEPDRETPDEGIISFTVECSSLASPDFVGRGGADLNAELSQLLTRLYASPATKPLRKTLSLISGKKCWVLHVDALVLDSGGNLFGALSLAVRAALQVVALPRVVVIPGEADEDDEIEIDEEVFEMFKKAVDAPIAVTVSAIGDKGVFMADCTSEEEACVTSAVTVGVNKSGKACGVVSGGTGGVDAETLASMLKFAVKIGDQMLTTMDSFLQQDIQERLSDERKEKIGFFT